MTEDRVDKLTQRLAPIENKFDRSHILTVLYSRIAAGLENDEERAKETGFSEPDPAWEMANKYLFSLMEKDPEKAFFVAIDLTLFAESNDKKQERVNKWIRTSGLALLGLDENRERLDKYLKEGPLKKKLAGILVKNIKSDISTFKNPNDFYNPMGFTIIQSVYTGLGLSKARGKTAQNIFRLAESKKSDPEITNAAKILETFPGCEYFVGRL